MDLLDEFDKSDHAKNKARRTSVLAKRPIKANYLSFDHISPTVSNFAKNVSNYLIPDAKKAFN